MHLPKLPQMTMEKRWLFLFCLFLVPSVAGQPEALVAERAVVHALPGADVNLVCSFPNRHTTYIEQTQWSKISDTQRTAIAVYNRRYGTHYHTFPEASYNFSVSFSTRKCCSQDVTEALCSPDPNATSECSQWALHLKNVTVSLSGQYECSFATFPFRIMTSKIQLIVKAEGQPEAVVAERAVVHALPGADVNLVCSFPNRHTTDILQTQWSKISDTQRTAIAVYNPLDGTHYHTFPEASYNFSVSFSTRKCCSQDVTEALCSPDPNATSECSQWALHLKNVTVSLSGQYECRFATFPDGKKTSKIQLIVKAEDLNNSTTEYPQSLRNATRSSENTTLPHRNLSFSHTDQPISVTRGKDFFTTSSPLNSTGGARDTKASHFLWPTVVAVLLLFCSFLIALGIRKWCQYQKEIMNKPPSFEPPPPPIKYTSLVESDGTPPSCHELENL